MCWIAVCHSKCSVDTLLNHSVIVRVDGTLSIIILWIRARVIK